MKALKENQTLYIVAVAVVAVLLLLYFAVLPNSATNGYKNRAQPKQVSVQDKMAKVYDSFNRDVFTKTDTEPAADKNDLKIGLDAVREASDTIQADEQKLTGFTAYPWLGWNGRFKAATRVVSDERSYLTDAKKYLADYKTVLEYGDKVTDLDQQTASLDTQLSTATNSGDPNAVATALDNAANNLQKLLDQFKAITPPEAVRADHERQSREIEQLISLLRQAGAATRALDVAKLESAGTQIDSLVAQSAQADQQSYTKLHRDSSLQQSIDQLKALQGTLAQGYEQI